MFALTEVVFSETRATHLNVIILFIDTKLWETHFCFVAKMLIQWIK